MNSPNQLGIALLGSRDFVRRLTLSARKWEERIERESLEVTIRGGKLVELQQLATVDRCQLLVIEIGSQMDLDQVAWLKSTLRQLRDRQKLRYYVVLAATTPEKFAAAGSMLFATDDALSPSGLIDNFIISPPPGALAENSLEEQLINCLQLTKELLFPTSGIPCHLPTLWSENWVPTMCDPVSRETWLRWLPRYAGYGSENPIIIGPTGTGKTRMAAAIHLLSRRTGPFVSITPRDFSSMELVQAELFGAVAGAYTGAVEKWGLVKKAERGTLFIDELQSIDLELQGKLITFIENKSYRRVGETASHEADVRFVFASNRPLDVLVKEGKLRDDFAYRLERLQLRLPALSSRRLDISAGICFALGKISRERNSPSTALKINGITQDAYTRLFNSNWPGNLRQLENTIARALEASDIRAENLLSQESIELALQTSLGSHVHSPADIFAEALAMTQHDLKENTATSLRQVIATTTSNVRRLALAFCGGDAKAAAKLVDDSESAISLLAGAIND